MHENAIMTTQIYLMLIRTCHSCCNVGSEQNKISLVRSNENIFVQNQPTGQFEYFCQNQQNGIFFLPNQKLCHTTH
jgi:hypothetical protein